MTHCLNPHCSQPENPDHHRFCQRCGWRLRLGDRYEAVYPIGAGENSRTFIARDRTTLVQPQCLIKQFTPHGKTVLAQASAAERFRVQVHHFAIAGQQAHMPDLLAYFEREHHQFLVQQFLVGPHLDQELQDRGGPFSSREVMAFLRDVLPIVRHLHQHQIIHRDIKPTNFRRPPGQAHWWLVDVGVIKPGNNRRDTTPGSVVGSAEYAAPEQLRGEASFASDLYSVGLVCLHLLTRLRPFDLYDSGHGCWRWRSIVPDVPEKLALLLDRMVQPAVRDRIATVDDILPLINSPLPPDPTPTLSIRHLPSTWQADESVELGSDMRAMADLPQADRLIFLTANHTLEVRSRSTLSEKPEILSIPVPGATSLAAHPKAPQFVVGTRSGTLHRWVWEQGRWHPHAFAAIAASITHMTFSGNGKILIVGDRHGTFWLLDATTGAIKAQWQQHTHPITCLAWNAKGTQLASGDSQGRLTLWNWETGECLKAFSRQSGALTAIGWLPNDAAIAIAAWDMTLCWRCPATSAIWQSVNAEGFCLPVRSLLVHPHHSVIFTGSQDGRLQGWAFTPQPKPTVRAIATADPETAPVIGLCWQSTAMTGLSALLSLTQTGQLTRRSWSSVGAFE